MANRKRRAASSSSIKMRRQRGGGMAAKMKVSIIERQQNINNQPAAIGIESVAAWR
jgi:hypothetical protein